MFIMTESERAMLRRLRAKYNRAAKARHKELGRETVANIIATTMVPYDPDGARRFDELDRALREGRA